MDSELGFSLGGQQSQAEVQAQLDFFRARAAGIVKQSVYIAVALWSGMSKRPRIVFSSVGFAVVP